MNNDSTLRHASLPMQIRNVRARLAVLTLRRINNGSLTQDEQNELNRLQEKLDKLSREETAMKYQVPS